MCNWAVTEPSDYGFSNQKRKMKNFPKQKLLFLKIKKWSRGE